MRSGATYAQPIGSTHFFEGIPEGLTPDQQATWAKDCTQPCAKDADCPGHASSCVSGKCTFVNCTYDADCSNGKICGVMGQVGRNAGGMFHVCMTPGPSALGGSCRTGGDCATGQCYAGICVNRCAKTSDCTSGQQCVVGPIVPGDPPFCTEPHCVGCTSDQYCDEYRRCQPGTHL